MYFVSPFTPLFFNPSTDVSSSPSCYIQKFSPEDRILVEVICFEEEVPVAGRIVSMFDQSPPVQIAWKTWSFGNKGTLLYYEISGLSDGIYTVEINGNESEPFGITSNESELNKTTLIRYSMEDNRHRTDAVFWAGDRQFFFENRIHGGFLDDNWKFLVDNEKFTDAENNQHDIYSKEYTQKAFTMGTSQGCPIWHGELLNRILSCTFIEFDGKKYTRAGNSTPDVQRVPGCKRSYVFTQQLLQIVDRIGWEDAAPLSKDIFDSTFDLTFE